MSRLRRPDCFEVINGPEDGSRFPVFRVPFYIGSAQRCDIILRLDDDIKATHVKLSKAFGGYCVRCCGRASVYVDGRRSGWLRTRVVRPGGVIQVGNTLLRLASAQEEMARATAQSSFNDTKLSSKSGKFGMSRWFAPLTDFVKRHWMVSSISGTFLLYYVITRILDFLFRIIGSLFHSTPS